MPSPWQWDDRSKRYRNTESGRFISQRTAVKLRDAYTAGKVADADRLSRKLVNREINLQEWTLEMRRQIKDAYVNQYMLARGGKNNMTQADWGRVGGLIHGQYHYLEGFSSGNDTFSVAQTELPELSARFLNLTRDLQIIQTIYSGLRSQYETVRIEEMNNSSRFQVIETAEVPEKKSWPRRSVICVVVTMAAFFFSVLAAFIKEYFVRARRDPVEAMKLDDIKRMLRPPR